MGRKNSVPNRGASVSHPGDSSQEQGARPDDGNDSDDEQSLLERIEARLEQLEGSFTKTLNRAVKDHVAREFKRHADSQPSDSDPKEDASSKDEPAPATGEKSTPADRHRDTQLEDMRKEIADLRKAEEEKTARIKKMAREDAFRKVIDGVGVRNQEATFRYLMPDLQIDEETGEYYMEVDGKTLNAKQAVEHALEKESWMQPLSGQNGGGGNGPAKQVRSAPGTKYDENRSAEQNLAEYFRNGGSGKD